MKIFPTLSKISAVLALVLVVCACSSEDDESTTTVTLHFEVLANTEPVVFDSKKYLTASNQSVSIEQLQVYVSNVQFREEGNSFIEPDSYHLLGFNADHGSASFEIQNVPTDLEISEIVLSIGVDSDANTSIDHMGDLDPTNGMAWDWNTGYKFLFLDGRYFEGDDPLGEEVKMHIGTDKNYVINTYTIASPANASSKNSFQFMVDALSPFGAIDLSEGTVFMNDERGDQVAENYKSTLIKLK